MLLCRDIQESTQRIPETCNGSAHFFVSRSTFFQIAAPVDGIVHVRPNNRIDFQTTDPEFAEMEIVIENIDPERNSDGKRFKSGKRIGRATRVTVCKPNFIHVSVRQAKKVTAKDSEYDYIDPSPFLDRLVPVPKWIQECNDHEFR